MMRIVFPFSRVSQPLHHRPFWLVSWGLSCALQEVWQRSGPSPAKANSIRLAARHLPNTHLLHLELRLSKTSPDC